MEFHLVCSFIGTQFTNKFLIYMLLLIILNAAYLNYWQNYAISFPSIYK